MRNAIHLSKAKREQTSLQDITSLVQLLVSLNAAHMGCVLQFPLTFLDRVSVTLSAMNLEIAAQMSLSLDVKKKMVGLFNDNIPILTDNIALVPQTFPYIELGVTSGVETEIVDPEGSPSIIDMPFPFLYNFEPTITVSIYI